VSTLKERGDSMKFIREYNQPGATAEF